MKRLIEDEAKTQVDAAAGVPGRLRVVDDFVNELDLGALGFEGADLATTGRPTYHPAVLLKIYIYGYLNRIQSSRRIER